MHGAWYFPGHAKVMQRLTATVKGMCCLLKTESRLRGAICRHDAQFNHILGIWRLQPLHRVSRKTEHLLLDDSQQELAWKWCKEGAWLFSETELICDKCSVGKDPLHDFSEGTIDIRKYSNSISFRWSPRSLISTVVSALVQWHPFVDYGERQHIIGDI